MMKEMKLVPIGNSKGIRLPKTIIRKYNFEDSLILVEADDGVFLRNKNSGKLSWEDSYKMMAEESENWDEFDVALLDGIDE